MDPGKMVPAKNPVFQNRFLILFCLTIFTIILNLTGLMAGITMVLPHLFYIPIILAGYWYPRRGIHFSVMIALVYGLLVFSFPSTSPDTVIATLSRMVIFVVIGGVVSLLSHRRSPNRSSSSMTSLSFYLMQPLPLTARAGSLPGIGRSRN